MLNRALGKVLARLQLIEEDLQPARCYVTHSVVTKLRNDMISFVTKIKLHGSA